MQMKECEQSVANGLSGAWASVSASTNENMAAGTSVMSCACGVKCDGSMVN